MKRLVLFAVAATAAVSVSAAPAHAVGGTAVGLITHAWIVSKCQNRELTREEARKTSIFPFFQIYKALQDCKRK